MTLQEKLAAIVWPKDIARVGAYHVYRGKYYGTLDDGQSAETPYQRDCATAALALLEVCREWIEADTSHREPCLRNTDVYEHPCLCGRDALLAGCAAREVAGGAEMTTLVRFRLGLAGGLITDTEGDWVSYRGHTAEIARLTAERDEWRDADQAECALNARLRAQCAEMRGERDAAELSRDAAHAEYERLRARLAECESQLRAVALKP